MAISEELKYISHDRGKTKVFYRVHKNPNAENTLFLIHGLASNMTRWTELVQNIRLKNCNIIRIDLRGHGESELKNFHSLRTWIRDINAVLDQEGIFRANFLGHSLGATVSMNMAHKHPEKVKKLIMIDPVFPKALKGQLGYLRRLRSVLPLGLTITRLFNKAGFGRKEIPVRDLKMLDEQARDFLENGDLEGLVKLCMSTKEDLKFIRLANYVQDLHIVLKSLPPLEEINQQTLILLSKGGSISDFDTSKKFIEKFPNQKTIVVDADHWMLTEKPVETREAIESWLS